MSSMLPATSGPSGGQSEHDYPGWPRAVLFVIAGILLAARRAAWRVIGLVAIVLSVAVIAPAPGQAVAGLVVDGLVLIFAATSWLASSRREG